MVADYWLATQCIFGIVTRTEPISLYDLPSESYLRSVQVSDSYGQVTFTTIVPGCCNGRYTHVHFEVFSSLNIATRGSYARLISQFAIPAEVCATVYAIRSYATSLRNYNNGNNSNPRTMFSAMQLLRSCQ